jgi:hypothetical protein
MQVLDLRLDNGLAAVEPLCKPNVAAADQAAEHAERQLGAQRRRAQCSPATTRKASSAASIAAP